MSEIIKLNSAFFSAGSKYHWPYNSVGFGIDWRLLQGEGVIEVQVGDKDTVYSIDKAKAREAVNRYKAFHLAKTIKLGVVPRALFEAKTPMVEGRKKVASLF